MTALVLTAVLATGPTLPVVDGIDQGAEARGAILEQIVAHQEYTDHMHDVWRHRRHVAADAATVTTTEPSYSYSGGWADELAAAGFPSSVIPTMEYIIERESGGNPSAVNAMSGACGLLQLYPCPSGGLDPMTNLRLGFAKYEASGLSPWGM